MKRLSSIALCLTDKRYRHCGTSQEKRLGELPKIEGR